MESKFSTRLKELRSVMRLSQKEFAELIGIPQPTMSAYENGRNNPTIDAAMEIASKCNVSLDWLCGRDDVPSLGNLSELVRILYDLYDLEDVQIETTVHDKLLGGDTEEDGETDENKRWWVQLRVYGNDHDHSLNGDICNIVRKINEQYRDFTSYGISEEMYQTGKEKLIEHYEFPLRKKEYPDLSYEERMKQHIEYIEKHYTK